MNNKQAYDRWSGTYDQVPNKTRDLEATAIRQMLAEIPVESCLEIGCGTGKNTEWLAARAEALMAVDFSAEMLARAKAKDFPPHVDFVLADISESWKFADKKYDLVSFSLVLEHIEDLDHVFSETSRVLRPGGFLYLGELHPFKQYSGSKARFKTGEGEFELGCFTHHLSEYLETSRRYGFQLQELRELFVPQDERNIPQILALLLRKE